MASSDAVSIDDGGGSSDAVPIDDGDTAETVRMASSDAVPIEDGGTEEKHWANLYNKDWMPTDSESESEETVRTKNRSGFSDRALEFLTKDHEHVGYTILGERIQKILNDSELQGLLEQAHGKKDQWRTVIDFANQKKIVLKASDIATIRRIQSGQYPGKGFDPYSAEYSVVDFEFNDFDMPFRDEHRRSDFASAKIHEEREILAVMRKMLKGEWQDPEIELLRRKEVREANEAEVFDLWSAQHLDLRHRGLPMVPAPKEELPGDGESYNPPADKLDEGRETPGALRLIPHYKHLLEERNDRLLDLVQCERSWKMQMNIDKDSLLPPLPPMETMRPFPTEMVFRMSGMTLFRLKGEAGDNAQHYDRLEDHRRQSEFSGICAIDVWGGASAGSYVAIGDERGAVSVVYMIGPTVPGAVIWRDYLRVAKDLSRDREETRITAVKFHPSLPILAICKGLKVFYVIIPELIGECPIKKRPKKSWTEESAVKTYWKLYRETPVAAALVALGLDGTGAARDVARDPEANRATTSHRSIFSIQMLLSHQEMIDLEQMGSEEAEIHERAGPTTQIASGTLYLPTRPGLSLSVTHRVPITNGNWHQSGKYFAVCSARASNARDAVIVHWLTRWQSRHILKKRLAGCHSVFFHPKEASIIVGYLGGAWKIAYKSGFVTKKMIGGGKAVAMTQHRLGNALVAAEGHQIYIFDSEAGGKPVQKLSPGAGMLTTTSMSPRWPLVAATTMKGAILITYITVPELSPAFGIPVKLLNGKKEGPDGTVRAPRTWPVRTCVWHPMRPWLITGHADGAVCIWT